MLCVRIVWWNKRAEFVSRINQTRKQHAVRRKNPNHPANDADKSFETTKRIALSFFRSFDGPAAGAIACL